MHSLAVWKRKTWTCSLTWAENSLENRAGISPYQGGFLLRYLDALCIRITRLACYPCQTCLPQAQCTVSVGPCLVNCRLEIGQGLVITYVMILPLPQPNSTVQLSCTSPTRKIRCLSTNLPKLVGASTHCVNDARVGLCQHQ
jgi:hypothetical protein